MITEKDKELKDEAFDKWIDYVSDVLQMSDASDGSLLGQQKAFVDAYVMGAKSIKSKKTEEELLDSIFKENVPLWKGKYKVRWCNLCDTAYIGCTDSNCDGTSCNGCSCEKCHEDHRHFNTLKASVEDYLSDEEIEIYRKCMRIKDLIITSFEMGDDEINIEKLKSIGYLSDNDIQTLGIK